MQHYKHELSSSREGVYIYFQYTQSFSFGFFIWENKKKNYVVMDNHNVDEVQLDISWKLYWN